jgi:N-glycosidase YbiA
MPLISNFHGENFFLSNFFPAPVSYEGEIYPTVEHAFQAAKTLDREQRKSIQDAETPAKAKQMGKTVTLRPDWEQEKLAIMLELLRQKFSQPELRQKLLATDDAELIEGNTWGDRFWGCVLVEGQWVGQNHLGKLLMQVRAETEDERPRTKD